MKPSKSVVKIKEIDAFGILDSRGFPGIRICLELSNGMIGNADASFLNADTATQRERVEYARTAVSNALKGKNVCDQEKIDASLMALHGRGGEDFTSVLRSVSMACARVAAEFRGEQLLAYLFSLAAGRNGGSARERVKMPLPILSVLYGRASGDTDLDFREYCLVPIRRSRLKGAATLGEELRRLALIVRLLGTILERKRLGSSLGKGGGYAAALDSTLQAFDFMIEAIREAGLKPGTDVALGIDLGSSALFDDRKGEYRFKAEQSFLSREQMIELLLTWMETYPISYVQDPLDRDDWKGMAELLEVLDKRRNSIQGPNLMIANEDAVNGDASLVAHAARVGASSCVVVPWSRMRTVTEAMRVVHVARTHRMEVVVSRGSDVSSGAFLADFALAAGADTLKLGSLVSSESIQCHNRLVEIERELR